MSEIVASYLLHDNKGNFHKKAEGIALGLTVGSWTDLPLLDQQQLQKHKGRVVSVTELQDCERVNGYLGGEIKQAIVKIAYPTANFSKDLPAILVTVFGKLSLDGKVKLLDLDFPDELLAEFPGPRFGIEGIREKLGVYDRPLVMSIFKGVIGRGMTYLTTQLREQALGGVDLVKDDEILFDSERTPFEARVTEGKKVLNEVYEKTGHRTLYAVNLTGRTFELKEKARKAAELGADALLFNAFAYGLDVLQELREDDEINLPIMAHPAVSGALTPSEFYGFSNSLLLGKLLRLAGADFSLFPSPYGSVALSLEDTTGIPCGDRCSTLSSNTSRKSGRIKRVAKSLRTMGNSRGESMTSLKIFCDFDGTITNSDNIIAIMKQFAPPEWESIKDDVLAQRVSIQEGVGQMFALLPVELKEDIISYILETSAIRDGFDDFIAYTKEHHIPLYIEGGEFFFFKKPFLENGFEEKMLS